MAVTLTQFAALADEQRRKAVIQQVTNESTFLRLLNFIPVQGHTYEYTVQTDLGDVDYRSLNEQYTPDNGDVERRSEALKIFGGQVQVDHQLQNKQGGIAVSNAIMARTKRVALTFDKCVIDGDTAVNDKQFDGLAKRITTDQTITAGTNGAPLTLDFMDRLIDKVAGPSDGKRLVMCKQDRRKLKTLVLAAAGGAGVFDVGGSLSAYDGVAIEVLDEDGDDNAILDKDETQGSSTTTSSIYCVQLGGNVDGIGIQGLIGTTTPEVYESGMTGVLHNYIIEMNVSLAMFHERAAARLKGLT